MDICLVFKLREEYLKEDFYNRDKEKKRILNVDYEDIGVAIAAANIATAVCKRKSQKSHKLQAPRKVQSREWWNLCYQVWPLDDINQPLQMEEKMSDLIGSHTTIHSNRSKKFEFKPYNSRSAVGRYNISIRPWCNFNSLVAAIWSISIVSK